MTPYLKWCGAAAVMIAALIISREYSSYARKRLAQYEGISEFVACAEGKIRRYLTPRGEIWLDFKCEALESTGFLDKIRGGADCDSAFSECRDKFLVAEDEKDEFSSFLSDFGGDYRDGVLKKISDYKSRLDVTVKKEREELTKSVKVARTLLLAAALGVTILLL